MASETKKMEAGKVQGKKRGKTWLWAIGLTVWVGVAFFAVQIVVFMVAQWLLAPRGIQIGSSVVAQAVCSAISYALALAVIIAVPKRLRGMKISREEMGLRGLPTWTDILLSPIGYVLSLIAAAIIAALFSGVNWGQEQELGFDNIVTNMDRVITFLALAVLAPIAEELIFRGFLYGKLRSRLSAFWAILLVSVLFGLMHGQLNVGIIVGVMSIFMCLAREMTGTIYAGILMHMIRNGVAFYFLYVLGGVNGIGMTAPLLMAFLI